MKTHLDIQKSVPVIFLEPLQLASIKRPGVRGTSPGKIFNLKVAKPQFFKDWHQSFFTKNGRMPSTLVETDKLASPDAKNFGIYIRYVVGKTLVYVLSRYRSTLPQINVIFDGKRRLQLSRRLSVKKKGQKALCTISP